jgi:hypothetical protein
MSLSYRAQNRRRHAQFRRWLGQQRARQDAVGDFARDFLADPCAASLTTISGIDSHLRTHHDTEIIERVLDARDRAWRELAQAHPDPEPQP